MYIQTLILVFVGILANILKQLTVDLKFVGRRRGTFITMVLMGIALLILLGVPDGN